MSKVFTARFDISGAGPFGGVTNQFEVFGDVIDPSLAGYAVSDVSVGNVFFDENSLSGDHNRYRITQVLARGRLAFQGATANSVHAVCLFDDEGAADSNGPEAGSGCICAATANGAVAEIPAFSIYGISEALHTRMININNRHSVAPYIADGTQVRKAMVNGHSASVPAGTLVAKILSGAFVPAKSIVSATPVGITKSASAVGEICEVFLIGQNVAGALVGLGFAVADAVYLSENGGYTNNANSLTNPNDTVVRVGIADCASGVANSAATDLIMLPEIMVHL